MRRIVKRNEPRDLRVWKRRHPEACYDDLSHDARFPGAARAKAALRRALLKEQRGLCCYCETLIDDGNFHVEHFRPKDPRFFPHLQLSYDNLHACCHKIPCGGSEENCGHKKGNRFNENLVSPLEPDCESHFRYDLTGRIFPADQRGADTITMLNLNSALLRESRKALIEYFEDMDDDTYDLEITLHLDPDAYPLGEFYTTIRSLHHAGLLH